MNILFITIAYPKSGESNIYSDLMDEFTLHGHQVYVACSQERRYGKATSLNDGSGVKILRIKTGNLTGDINLFEKGLSTILLERIFIKQIKSFFSALTFDLIIYTTPPITFARVVKFLKQRHSVKTYLLLKDIFPQNAVDIGLIKKNSIIYKYFRNKEKRLYQLSDYIGCMSEANVDYVRKHNSFINSECIEICPNSIKPSFVNKNEDIIELIKQKYHIPSGKTLYIYGGNLGKPQGVDFLLDCLRSNKNSEDVFFIIVGSGVEYSRIEAYIDSEKLGNVKLIAKLPKNDYELLVAACDVGLIFLDKRFTIPNFPSRILSYMQAEMPILAATDKNTDLGKTLEDGHFGFWCESGDLNSFNQYLQRLTDIDLRYRMGEAARKYLEDNFTVSHSYRIIMNHFN